MLGNAFYALTAANIESKHWRIIKIYYVATNSVAYIEEIKTWQGRGNAFTGLCFLWELLF